MNGRTHSRIGLGLIAVLGAGFAAIVPPFQISDEHAHFVRAYEVSRGHWVGSSDPALPADVVEAIRRYPEKLEWVKKLNADDEAAGPFSAEGEHYWLHRGIIAANVYCPIAYLPASAGIALGRVLGLPALGLFYLGRSLDVLLLVAACALAFRLAPDYWHTIAAVALLPTTLHQAGAVTADVMTIGLSIAAMACLLWLRQNTPGARALAGIVVVFAALALCKISPWAFSAVLLIPARAFSSRRNWLAYLTIIAGAMLAAVWVWQALSRGSLDAFRAVRLRDGFDMAARAAEVVRHPISFTASAAAYFVRHVARYLVHFVGGFGWTKFYLPLWVQPLCLVALVTVAATEQGSKPFSATERALLAGVFVIGVVFLHTALYVSDSFDGIQGRYFTPFCLFGLLAVRQTRVVLPPLFLTWLVIGFGLVHGIASLIWIWRAYYV
jgi:uncharacterized membrane protein